MNDAIETRLDELRKLAKEFAEAQAQRDYLDEFKKSKLSMLMKRFESDYPTAAAQEREARAHQEYIDLLTGLKAATERAEFARWSLKIAEMGAGLWQTKQANMRAERRAYGA